MSLSVYNEENMTEKYDLEIYSTETGKEPFNMWMSSLKDKRAMASIFLRLQRIRQGNFGDCKALKNGLHELRIDHGTGLRVYFAKIGSKILLLLGGGDKSSQEKDIEKCKAFLEDYKLTLCTHGCRQTESFGVSYKKTKK